MPERSHKQWEQLRDQRNFVDVSRLHLPDGWLVHASPVGGRSRFGAYLHYDDRKHEWRPLEGKGVLGPVFSLQWEKVMDRPEGFVARLRIPGGWFLFVDFQEEGSSAQLVFCPDGDHKWMV
jgi:hypothetical protein